MARELRESYSPNGIETGQATRRASTSTSITRVRLGKMWVLSWGKQETWSHRTVEKLRYWMPSMPQQTSLQKFQVPEARLKGWSKEDGTLVEDDHVREYLNKLDIQKPLGPDGNHSRIYGQLCQQGEVPKDWRKANVNPIFKKNDPGNDRLVSLTLIP